MFCYSDDPVRDAENYYSEQARREREWRAESYIGDCPLCGRPMYADDMFDPVERDVYVGDEYYEHVHRDCFWDALDAMEEEEEEEECWQQRPSCSATA